MVIRRFSVKFCRGANKVHHTWDGTEGDLRFYNDNAQLYTTEEGGYIARTTGGSNMLLLELGKKRRCRIGTHWIEVNSVTLGYGLCRFFI